MAASDSFATPGTDLCWYVGARKTGKTHLCLRHTNWRARDGKPCLIVDSMRAENLRGVAPIAASCEDAIERVWQRGLHASVTPETEEAAAVLFEAVLDLGKVHLLLDESARWLTGRRTCKPLELLLRGGRHRGVTVGLTTQDFGGDIPPWVFQVEPAFYVFRMRGSRALERLVEQFQDDDADDLAVTVKHLPNWQCLLLPGE